MYSSNQKLCTRSILSVPRLNYNYEYDVSAYQWIKLELSLHGLQVQVLTSLRAVMIP